MRTVRYQKFRVTLNPEIVSSCAPISKLDSCNGVINNYFFLSFLVLSFEVFHERKRGKN